MLRSLAGRFAPEQQFKLAFEAPEIADALINLSDVLARQLTYSLARPLECELLDRRHFRTQVEARMAVFEFIEGWYNPHRRHSALDYLSPINYERSRYSEELTASRPPSTQPG